VLRPASSSSMRMRSSVSVASSPDGLRVSRVSSALLAGDPAREVGLCTWLIALNAALLADLPVLALVAADAVTEPAADGARTAALEAAYERALDEDEALEAAYERALVSTLDGRNVSVGLRWRVRRPSFSSSFSVTVVSAILLLRMGGCGRLLSKRVENGQESRVPDYHTSSSVGTVPTHHADERCPHTDF
jgi:hypothetical protein